ncbi:MAG TPA: nucleoside triphosphate pyrophosphatase [Stellaceae bacterium]|nr:nucleoside triphosphate pyrophosphatase [Stellaceae bacterium]
MTGLGGGPIVLASASATRAAILAGAGIEALRDPAGIDEDEIKRSFRAAGRDAVACATALAETKATRVSARHIDMLVVGADQMLDCAGTWFDKPGDRAEARAQLVALRGKRHELLSAVTVVKNGAVIWHLVDRPRLTMRAFSDRFLDAYLAALGDDALASVGVYQLEGLGAQLFERIDGDYFSILGLPLLPLLDFLRGHGVVPS